MIRPNSSIQLTADYVDFVSSNVAGLLCIRVFPPSRISCFVQQYNGKISPAIMSLEEMEEYIAEANRVIQAANERPVTDTSISHSPKEVIYEDLNTAETEQQSKSGFELESDVPTSPDPFEPY